MPSDLSTRVSKYTARLNVAGALSPVSVARKQDMIDKFAARTAQLMAGDLAVKQICDGAAVATIQYPFYLAFGRELLRLQLAEISGDSLAKEAAILLAKWVARGLTQAVLADIRSQGFNIPAPVAP